MISIPFTKMSGAGNDFILIDNREGIVPPDDVPRFVEKICRRKVSAGADGMILVERSGHVDFKWRFFNSDGSMAEMCGNGARCAARFAFENGIAGKSMRFETIAGIIQAQVLEEHVKIKVTQPSELILDASLNIDAATVTYSSVNTGVPHVVVEVEDIDAADVVAAGRVIRHHPDFAPAGTNVNFLAPLADGHWAVRTYERGVEDETLACGTGIVASALVLAVQKGAASPIVLRARSDSLLKVHFTKSDQGISDIFLEGDARIIYQGRLMPDAWEY